MEIKETFQKVPDRLLEIKMKSLKAVYMYAKMLMLRNYTYNREVWVTNPITREKEMSVDTLSDITKKLMEHQLIRLEKISAKGQEYPTNRYIIEPFEGFYKPVYNNFINYPSLSADAKGLGILLCLMKEIPKTTGAISKLTGISYHTTAKYLNELYENNIIDKETMELNDEFFPFKKQNEKKLEEKYAKDIEYYEMCLAESKQTNPKISKYTLQTVRYADSLEETPLKKAMIFRKASWGAWKIAKEPSPEKRYADITLS